jgi:hypothetical protein
MNGSYSEIQPVAPVKDTTNPVKKESSKSAVMDPFSLVGSVNKLVGPISEKYCYYFYILAVISVFFFAIVLVGIVYRGITTKQGAFFYFIAILWSCQFLLAYLQNRLLYNMCAHSI